MKIISGLLILVTVYLQFKHAWSGLTMNVEPKEAEMFKDLGISRSLVFIISILSLAVGVMVLFPPTFFAANLINAAMILGIMALALRAGNFKLALIEIPFLLMPLVMIWLGHPLGGRK